MALPICQRGISAALSVFSWPQSMFCVGVRCLDSSAKNANSSGSPRVYNVPSKRAKFLTKRKSSGFECSGRSHLRFALLVFIRFSPSVLCAFYFRHFDPPANYSTTHSPSIDYRLLKDVLQSLFARLRSLLSRL